MRDIPADGDDAAIAMLIITMAHDLKLSVVAEGVETEEQRHFLEDKNCDVMQGYLFSAPVPAVEFERLLRAAASGISAAPERTPSRDT